MSLYRDFSIITVAGCAVAFVFYAPLSGVMLASISLMLNPSILANPDPLPEKVLFIHTLVATVLSVIPLFITGLVFGVMKQGQGGFGFRHSAVVSGAVWAGFSVMIVCFMPLNLITRSILWAVVAFSGTLFSLLFIHMTYFLLAQRCCAIHQALFQVVAAPLAARTKANAFFLQPSALRLDRFCFQSCICHDRPPHHP
jgi:hypothetical protein